VKKYEYVLAFEAENDEDAMGLAQNLDVVMGDLLDKFDPALKNVKTKLMAWREGEDFRSRVCYRKEDEQKRVTISVERYHGYVEMAVLDEMFNVLRDFEKYENESGALDVALRWCKENGCDVVDVVHPRLTGVVVKRGKEVRHEKDQ